MNMKIEFHYPCDKIEGGGISSLKLTQFSWLLLHIVSWEQVVRQESLVAVMGLAKMMMSEIVAYAK